MIKTGYPHYDELFPHWYQKLYRNKVACFLLGHVWMWDDPFQHRPFCGSCGKIMTGKEFIKEIKKET